ncbi:Guanylate kinase [Candidatus Protochlamydia naegleriophila]|uniref:Guanylate kinase n=2 Tax=Candidatus Protochlamydia naegleriophila TaxID=389348 RepID=A0A0U5JDW1_9BACT|nr:Guanylate kinase [Candidatus Protochlamydia naegleriophila]
MGLLENRAKGLMFVISAPAGTGKTTLVDMLTNEFASVVANISYTTRQPRSGEVYGQHYHFITQSEFEAKIAASDFLEYVKLYGTYYGTSRRWIEEQRASGQHVILVIDTQGALQLKGRCDATFIFIRPPSLEVLKQRLVHRQTESTEMIEQRLACAERELDAAQYYDYQIINDDLNEAYQVLRSILIAECHRTSYVCETNRSLIKGA